MQIDMVEKDGAAVCKVEGDVDINSSPNVKKYFDQLTSGKKEKILINFSRVNYIDSSGLATLVEIYKKVKVYGGKLVLTDLSEKVYGLFEITKLNKLFNIVSTEEEGLSSS